MLHSVLSSSVIEAVNTLLPEEAAICDNIESPQSPPHSLKLDSGPSRFLKVRGKSKCDPREVIGFSKHSQTFRNYV